MSSKDQPPLIDHALIYAGLPNPPLPNTSEPAPATPEYMNEPELFSSKNTPSPQNQKGQKVVRDRLYESFRSLQNRSRLKFPSLSSVVESLIRCLDGLDATEQDWPDFEDFVTELTSTEMGQLLTQYPDGASPILRSGCAASMTMSIDQQVEKIKGKLGHPSKGERWELEGKEELIRGYRQIQVLLRRVRMYIDKSTWSIANEHLANARLDGLRPAKQAPFDSSLSTEINRRGCTEGTRVGVLAGLDDWVHHSMASPIYWMNGMAGTGKTTIASTFCERIEQRKLLAASFFCTRSSAECRNVSRIVPSIAYQLARYSMPYQSVLCEALGQNPDIGSQNVSYQLDQLLNAPLQKVKDTIPEHLVIVIDALDECDDRDGVEKILDLLLHYTPQLPLKFLITSRPEPEIYDKMSLHSGSREVLHLHELEKSLVRADIELYLNKELAFISPSPADIEQLVQRSDTLFIYAATLVRYVYPGKKSVDPHKRLRSLLSMHPSAIKQHTHIDALYMAVLNSALLESERGADESSDITAVLRTVLLAQEPISVETIAKLGQIDDISRIDHTLHLLRSVLHQSEVTGLVSTLHASFPDFMFNNRRSGPHFCDIVEHSLPLAHRCFLAMKEQLCFNICSLESSFLPDDKIDNVQARIKYKVSPTLAYACCYWSSHLAFSPKSEVLLTTLNDFLSHRLLFWMEVLTLRHELVKAVDALLKARQWLNQGGSATSEPTLLVEDAHNFVTGYTASPASQSTPHIYVSALPLCPRSSSVYKHYSKRMQGLLELKGSLIKNREMAPLAIWDTGSTARSISYSPDGSRVAIGNSGREVMITIRNAYNGAMLIGPLRIRTTTIWSVAFSPDGRYIASGSADETIRVWNAYNGKAIAEPFRGHTDSVLSISFSPDSTHVVSGSSDCTVRIWDVYSGTLVQGPLEGHTAAILSVSFSPDGNLVASASEDRTVRLWNSRDGTLATTPLIGHTFYVSSVAFTPEGTRIVSASWDRTIRVWNVADGSLVCNPFEGHKGAILSAIISPDGTRIASASTDCTVRVWNIDDGSLISGPFVGHTDGAISIAYSPDGSRLISGSGDGSIRVWNVRDNALSLSPFPPPKVVSDIHSLAFSSKSTHFLSDDEDHIIRVWDVSDGSFTTGPVKARIFSAPESNMSPDNSYVVAVSQDFQVQIMSTTDGSVVAGPFGFQRNILSTIQFSHNSQAVIMGLKDGTIKICTLPGQPKSPIGSFMGHSGEVKLVTESPDRSLMVSYSEHDHALRVWSLITPALELPPCTCSLSGASKHDYSVLQEGWRITNEGWVVDTAENLLFWIPTNIASVWWSPYATVVVTEAGTLQVPKQRPLIGDEWSQCFVPE